MNSVNGNHTAIDISEIFRLPWTMADNAMTWLEPTRHCNMKCDACFQFNNPRSVKSLGQIKDEIEHMMSVRKCDAMLIAGGEPLTHPDILDITSLVKSYKMKPIIVTNAMGLDEKWMRELKKAGAFGFTLHIDAHQHRPGWINKNEEELNELRQYYADLCYDIGGLSCGYNVTVFPDTLPQAHKIVDWAVKNVNKVQVLTLIAVRMMHKDDPWFFHAGGREVRIVETPYVSREKYRNISASEIYNEIKKVLPQFSFNAFLGGTAFSDSPKWAIGNRIATKWDTLGYSGKKAMELLQNGHHLFTGKFLAYTKPALNRSGRTLFLLGLFDKNIRHAFGNYILAILKNPAKIFSNVYVQSLSVVQPIDVLDNGEEDLCDGCPNITYWDKRLVPACRLEEYMIYGTHFSMIPKDKVNEATLDFLSLKAGV
jgi:pyruvate-formate lyase-activating enzyme